MSAKAFDGLKQYGFEKEEELSVYDREGFTAKEKKIEKEKNSIYSKEFDCPVCGCTFKDKMIKSAAQKLVDSDTDLRPIYSHFEPYKYDILVCTECGYSGIKKYYSNISSKQADLVKQKITPKFKKREYPEIYDIDTAILRYKLALLNSVVKDSKISERAYLCLKIKWLYTSKIEILGKSSTEEIKQLKVQEKLFSEHTLNGFLECYTTETMPVFGLEEVTIRYLIAEFYRLLGFDKKSLLWFSKVITERGVNRRLKDRAIEQKNIILRSNK